MVEKRQRQHFWTIVALGGDIRHWQRHGALAFTLHFAPLRRGALGVAGGSGLGVGEGWG